MSIIDGMNATGMAMVAQSHRLNAISSNIANMESVATSPEESFKAKLVNFKTVNVGGAQSVVVTEVLESKAPAQPIFSPSHPLADEHGYVYGSNVNREEMVADMMSTESSYQLNSQLSVALKNLGLSTLQTINK
ncbi:flagellar basal body rod protein FlgC [Vibrio crassostreae]|uniref:flagellar basal body rod protein FlgC n=1 Tax=Vibrio crassostreae TaxID=246167 RepID=UPI001B3080E0|nr:flagellar basal body rod C-terminal domain-containing protein [Vibrio crassostreae]